MAKALSRKELYDLVWRKPVSEISRQYGLSDRGLGKLCERNGIPVPPRGYWAKIKSGYKVKKPPLLFYESGDDKAILEKREAPKLPDEPAKEKKLPDEIVEAMGRELTPEYRIKAKKSIRKYHPVIDKWNNETDYYGNKIPISRTERRSRIILSILLCALEERHFEISQNREQSWLVEVSMGRDSVNIGIIKRTRRELSPEEKAKSYYSTQKYTYDEEHTGNLSLRIFDNYSKVKKTYTETNEKSMSEMLNEIVA